MGSSESKETVSNDDDDPSILKVSEEVAQRILGKDEATNLKTTKTDETQKPKLHSREKLAQLENDFRKQTNILDQHFNIMKNVSDREFQNSLNETEAKFMKHSQYSHPCPEFEQDVLKCYQSNKDNPLTCFGEVGRFTECMYANRKNGEQITNMS